MYSQLSATQQQALDTEECPHCHTKGNIRQVWTRNGPTVKCDACQKKIYRPRGRAVSKGGLTTGGNASGTSNVSSAGGVTGHAEQGIRDAADGQTDGNGNPPSSNTANAAQAAVNKPLTQAASQALTKMEAAVMAEANRQIQAALKQLEQQQQEMKKDLEQQVSEQVDELRPTEVIVKTQSPDGAEQAVTIPNAHPLLAQVLKRIAAGITNFLLVGPSGSGKTTLVEQVAEALNLPYSVTPWSAGLTEGGVLGRLTPDGNFLASTYITAFEIPSVHNWDEIDAADPNVPLCANSGIGNGVIFLPNRIHSPKAVRHAQAYLFATANTWGIGADMQYVGRNQIDAAFKSRFAGGLFYCDYSADLERQLVPENQYRETFWEIRSRVYQHKLRRIWGTRELVVGAKMLRHGYTQPEIFKALTVGFSPDELAKLGVA